MSYFSNASAPPAVAIPHDGSFTLPEAEVMTVEQVQSHHPDRAQAIRTVEHMGMPRGLAEQSLASSPRSMARQTSVSNAGSARKNSTISSMSGHSNGSLPAVRTSVMVSNHL